MQTLLFKHHTIRHTNKKVPMSTSSNGLLRLRSQSREYKQCIQTLWYLRHRRYPGNVDWQFVSVPDVRIIPMFWVPMRCGSKTRPRKLNSHFVGEIEGIVDLDRLMVVNRVE